MVKMIVPAAMLLCVANAFAPSATFVRKSTQLYNLEGADLSGNTWKPTEGRMQSTDTGDYMPEGYDPNDTFAEGMLGSQAGLSSAQRKGGPAIPGLENLGEDAVMMGGIEVAEGIPQGMQFIPSSVPDGNFDLTVPITSAGQAFTLEIKPFCMGYEDYFTSFTADSHPAYSVSPVTGRMDRRGGEMTYLDVICDPRGKGVSQGDVLDGTLVVNIPEDGSKLTYVFSARIS